MPTAQAILGVRLVLRQRWSGRLPLSGAPTIPGVTPRSPTGCRRRARGNTRGGVSRVWGARVAARRCWSATTSTSTCGRPIRRPAAQDPTGRRSISRSSRTRPTVCCRATTPARRSPAPSLRRVLDVGANYTLSRAWGNFDAENVASGRCRSTTGIRIQAGLVELPRGRPRRRSAPSRAALGQLQPRFLPGLTLSVLQALESGVPYAAVNTNGVDPRPYVTNPNNVPDAARVDATTYFFGPRDEFHTEGRSAPTSRQLCLRLRARPGCSSSHNCRC